MEVKIETGTDNFTKNNADSPQTPIIDRTAAKDNKSKTLVTLSNIFSGVFLPLLVPTYAYVFVLCSTPLSTIPNKLKFISSTIVFVFTALIPLITILFLMRKGKVSDVAIENPKERKIPYIATILCYLLTAFYIWSFPQWLPMFFIGASVSAFIACLITFKYKISAHTISLGGLCALLIFLGFNHLSTIQIIPWICSAILISGAVGSARIFMGRHTPSQVYSGWLLGLVVSYLFMNL